MSSLLLHVPLQQITKKKKNKIRNTVDRMLDIDRRIVRRKDYKNIYLTDLCKYVYNIAVSHILYNIPSCSLS